VSLGWLSISLPPVKDKPKSSIDFWEKRLNELCDDVLFTGRGRAPRILSSQNVGFGISLSRSKLRPMLTMQAGLFVSLLLLCTKDRDVRYRPGMMTFAPYSIGD
jgi:hypothetical protein